MDTAHNGTTNGRNALPRKQSQESSLLSPPYIKDSRPRSIKEANSPADSLLDLYGSSKSDGPPDSHKRTANEAHSDDVLQDSSKWIHRDKLARIESEELQAAGITLPRAPRSRSKSQTRPRREQSQDKPNGRTRAPTGGTDQLGARSRKNSENTLEPKTPDLSSVPSWDFRLPEEIAEEGEGYFVPSGKGSKIPVAKTSPVPIPVEHIERDTPMMRKRDGSPGEEDSITYPKPRNRSGSLGNPVNGAIPTQAKRSATDTSPKKTAAGARKASGPGKPANGAAAGRPRTRGGPSKDSSSSGAATRPTTRSGELSPGNKQPEGEPPWMISAYRPDPRLPPDQQLLPTVARRLQQEKWEKEGKFGNIYDKEFRPLTDEGFLEPPEPNERNTPEEPQIEKSEEWPLKPEPPKSLGLQPPGRTGSYSTMPKINDPPLSPMPSPRHAPGQQSQAPSIVRVPDAPETTKKEKGGCGCCIVM